MERADRNERCECPYICRRANPELGYRYVSERTKRKHAEMDRKGKFASSAGVKWSQSYIDMANTGSLRSSIKTPRTGKTSRSNPQACLNQPGPTVSRRTVYRDARALVGSVARSFNFPTVEDYFFVGEHLNADDATGRDTIATGLVSYNPTLDEAIYRSTCKFQALLDTNNVSIDLQESILTSLFGSSAPELLPDGQLDFRNMSLGSLLRYAGREWRGGELGLRGLCSLNGISKLYCSQGMPSVIRWRLCLDEGGTTHDPRAYGASEQDDYSKTGLKCRCSSRPPSGLQHDCETCTERCEAIPCRMVRKNMDSFDYIPISAMLKMVCRSRTHCHSMLTMWRARHRWFRPQEGDIAPSFPIRNWWDGTKAKESSWFWDPEQTWELPVVCTTCLEVYQAFPVKCQELLAHFDNTSRTYDFVCKSCGTQVTSEAKWAQGDPRNVPLLAHWDGFQSASTVFRSTWTVETLILSAGSNSTLPPMPVLFIPNTRGDPSSNSDALNVCLRPLIAELIDLFVNGVDVEYNYLSGLIGVGDLPNKFTMRAMLVLFTGDHPAQCKFGGFATSGYSACRRCKMKSNLQHGPSSRPGGVVVYDGNREQYRHPPPRKAVTELRQAVHDLNACTTSAAHKELSQRTGVTGDSQVWKLHDLYGFNPSQDLTYDAMHVLALSMFKKYTELLIKDADRTPVGRDALLAGLAEVTKKKPRCFRGRWPKDPFSRLGYFKAEEHTNFVLYCVPHILYVMGYVPGMILCDLGRLVFEIARYFYISSRSETGWTEDMLIKCRMLFASWRIRHEEGVGATGSILDHVAGKKRSTSSIVLY
ncbi:hypothetical protein R1sor_006929 [Riccia sorocarpa]|uniref:Uncharacterized protein n=1 Tax=Riccia sorocarpa TaxID=122646 RepID=A0ABD3HPD7_9MARC